MIFFIHIPKTGGKTLNAILKNHFYQEEFLAIVNGKVKHTWEDFNENEINQQYSNVECFTGHYNIKFGERFGKPVKYITILRNPVDRYVSQYYDVLKKGKDTLVHLLNRDDVDLQEFDDVIGLNRIEEFLSHPLGNKFANLQTRYLSGVAANKTLNEADLKLAQQNLTDKLACFGLTEKFDQSMLLFKKVLGLRNVQYHRNYINYNKNIKPILSVDMIKEIQRINQYDMKLYDFASELFYKQTAVTQKLTSFALGIYKIKNRAYSLLNKPEEKPY